MIAYILLGILVFDSIRFSLVFLLAIFFSPLARSQCIELVLINDAGQPIIPNGLVVGIIVGDAPVFVEELPAHREKRTIGTVECPEDLTRQILALYNSSCLTERARLQSAEFNSTSLEMVVQRCAQLKKSLTQGD